MKSLKVKWQGIRPLIMHNGNMADPLNPYVRQVKSITSKGSKKLTESDYEAIDRLKWEGGCYWSDDLKGFYVPADNIERAILEGAKKSRQGKDFAAALFCVESEIPLVHAKKGKSKDEIYADSHYQIRKGVRIQKNRIISLRPLIPTGWTITFEVEFDESILNPKDVEKAMTEAGALVGIGDWRPKFGRFISEVIK